MSFRNVIVEIERAKQHVGPDATAVRDACMSTDEHKHHRLWAVFAHHVAHKYEQIEGMHLPAVINWNDLKSWISQHWVQILQGIAAILSIFMLL